jgi:hypothetical protein
MNEPSRIKQSNGSMPDAVGEAVMVAVAVRETKTAKCAPQDRKAPHSVPNRAWHEAQVLKRWGSFLHT